MIKSLEGDISFFFIFFFNPAFMNPDYTICRVLFLSSWPGVIAVRFPVIGFQLCPSRSSECRFIALVYWTHARAFELSSLQSWRRLCEMLYLERKRSIRVTGALWCSVGACEHIEWTSSHVSPSSRLGPWAHQKYKKYLLTSLFHIWKLVPVNNISLSPRLQPTIIQRCS